MGTTLDLCVLVRDRAFFAHAGDGRAYLVRPTATLQLTQDHALHAAQKAAGTSVTQKPPARNPLVNAIGMADEVVVDTLSVDLGKGDRILLATDGVHGAFDDEAAIARACAKHTPAAVIDALLREAREHGGHDNATAVLVEVQARFVKREADAGPSSRDLSALASCALLTGLPPSAILAALAAGVELEAAEGERLPREIASDLVAYVVLEGIVALPDGRALGPSGLLFAESLVGAQRAQELPTVQSSQARLIRIRQDDFAEVCRHDPALAASLYQRLARYLAG
jgi:PPM family protein phosphatase